MILRIVTVLFTLAISAQCTAQWHLARSNQLNDDGIMDVFTIADIAFVIRESAVFDSVNKETDLARLISPAAASKVGLPDKPTAELINRLLQSHQEYDLRTASAIDHGDDGFVWKLVWHLHSSYGGSSGIPYEYHAVVRADGSSVKPELYLCDDYGSGTAIDPDEVLFSALAIDDLLPPTQSQVDEAEIQTTAERAFANAISRFNFGDDFQSLPPERLTFSGKLTSGNEDADELEVWAVRFVHSSIDKPENVKYIGSIQVWVTSDLKTSTLSKGTWDAKSIRRPHSGRKAVDRSP